jgi:hypothetical protein
MKLDNIQKLLDETPLEIRIRITLQMADYDNWDNGTYHGDPELINRQLDAILSHIENWVEKGMISTIRK